MKYNWKLWKKKEEEIMVLDIMDMVDIWLLIIFGVDPLRGSRETWVTGGRTDDGQRTTDACAMAVTELKRKFKVTIFSTFCINHSIFLFTKEVKHGRHYIITALIGYSYLDFNRPVQSDQRWRNSSRTWPILWPEESSNQRRIAQLVPSNLPSIRDAVR